MGTNSAGDVHTTHDATCFAFRGERSVEPDQQGVCPDMYDWSLCVGTLQSPRLNLTRGRFLRRVGHSLVTECLALERVKSLGYVHDCYCCHVGDECSSGNGQLRRSRWLKDD